jgi:hypothetical protein
MRGQLQASASLPSGIKTSVSTKQEASCGPGVVSKRYGGEKNLIAASGIKEHYSWVPVRSLVVRISPEAVFGKLCPILQGKEQLPIIILSLLVPIFLQTSRVFQLVQNSQTLTEHKCQVLYLASLLGKPYHILTPKSDFSKI